MPTHHFTGLAYAPSSVPGEHLNAVVNNTFQAQRPKPGSLCRATAHSCHTAPCQCCQLYSKVTRAACCCCDSNCLSLLEWPCRTLHHDRFRHIACALLQTSTSTWMQHRCCAKRRPIQSMSSMTAASPICGHPAACPTLCKHQPAAGLRSANQNFLEVLHLAAVQQQQQTHTNFMTRTFLPCCRRLVFCKRWKSSNKEHIVGELLLY